MSNQKKIRIFLVQLLVGAGTLHLLPKTSKSYDEIVPKALPGKPHTWTTASGIAEIIIGLLISNRKTVRLGKKLATLLFVAVFPANIKMAKDWQQNPQKTGFQKFLGWARLPLQIPLVVMAAK